MNIHNEYAIDLRFKKDLNHKSNSRERIIYMQNIIFQFKNGYQLLID